eukprot:2284506-Amphidinium_carterae.1
MLSELVLEEEVVGSGCQSSCLEKRLAVVRVVVRSLHGRLIGCGGSRSFVALGSFSVARRLF